MSGKENITAIHYVIARDIALKQFSKCAHRMLWYDSYRMNHTDSCRIDILESVILKTNLMVDGKILIFLLVFQFPSDERLISHKISERQHFANPFDDRIVRF